MVKPSGAALINRRHVTASRRNGMCSWEGTAATRCPPAPRTRTAHRRSGLRGRMRRRVRQELRTWGRLRGVKLCFRFLIRPLAAERGFCASLAEGTSGAVARRAKGCRQIRGQLWQRLPFRFESTRQVASAVGSRNARSPGLPATLERLEALAHYVQKLTDVRPIRIAFEPREPRPAEAKSQVIDERQFMGRVSDG
jgi:hypothetical protein